MRGARSRARCPAALAAVLAAVLVGSSAAIGQPLPSATFGTIMATPIDTNHNGLYDGLVASIPLTVTSPGLFVFTWTLRFPSGSTWTSVAQVQNLSAGYHLPSFEFPGPLLFLQGEDGAYNVTLQVSACLPGPNGPTACSSVFLNTLTTRSYRTADFDPPPVSFGTPITDTGRDLNGDGLYDELDLQIPVVVQESAEVMLSTGSLYGRFGSPTSPPVRWLTPGTFLWEVEFPGLPIRLLSYNGSFTLDLSLAMPGLGRGLQSFGAAVIVAHKLYITRVYNYTEFTPPSATFRGAPSTDLAPSPTGPAQALVVHLPLHVLWEGDYQVQAALSWDPSWPPLTRTRIVHLEPGDPTVDLAFNGILVNRFPVDGPWTLSATASRLDGLYGGDTSGIQGRTPAYRRVEFESAPAIELRANLTSGGCPSSLLGCGSVWVVGPGENLSEQYGLGGASNGDSDVWLTLFPGTFDILVLSYLGSRAFQVHLTANATFTWGLSPPASDGANLSVAFGELNASTETVTIDARASAAQMRFVADTMGDGDGVATAAELERTIPYGPPAPLDFLTSRLHGVTSYPVLDDEPFFSGSLRAADVSGAAEIVSASAIEATLVRQSSTEVAPVPHEAHWINLSLIPSTTTFHVAYHITAPQGMAGSFTMVSPGSVDVEGAGAWMVVVSPQPYASTVLATIKMHAVPGTSVDLVQVVAIAVALADAAVFAVLLVAWFRRRRRRAQTAPGTSPPGTG